MKINQIPAIHSMIQRWRQPQTDKSTSDPALDVSMNPNNHSPQVGAPPSPKSPSKKSARGVLCPTLAQQRRCHSCPPRPLPPGFNFAHDQQTDAARGEPVTHPHVGDVFKRCGPVRIHETFECEDAVEPVRLLTLTRRTLVNEARARGGNALVDEVWEYTVSKRGKSGYTVKVDYIAGAALVTGDGAQDPQKPVAIDIAKTKGINGLMTVTSRH
ncbi:hypothetical protein OPQ81_009340 [Rhizoctonia solani]|nr:hypothetical protein OPQ81_009340 [Rhizoctonia solani]